MKNILLIDANPVTALDIFIHLQDEGFVVHGPIAMDEEGLKLLATENISLVLLDDEACKAHYPELRETLIASDLPIIFLTANNISNDDNRLTFNKAENSDQLVQLIKNLQSFSKAA